MDPERWRKIEGIYSHALTCPPAEIDHYLHGACGVDEALRSEVQSLLAANEQASSFLTPDHLARQVLSVAPPEPSPLIGRTLGHYELHSHLGSGGMGEVFAARDLKLDRTVAIKVLPAQFTRDPGRLARFEREAKTASALNHPNIITIYDIGSADGVHFIATEYIEGVTLRRRLAAGPIAEREAVHIAAQCAAALEAAHRAGIVHRDIKPENVMVRPDGLVKVLDFGLASISSLSAAAPGVTDAGSVMGTPRYMSPEQARGRPLDPRTDIFSLGAVLYEMLAGSPCFSGANSPEVFAALLSPEPVPRLHTASPGIRTAIAKALAKDPAQRYASIREFAKDLESPAAPHRRFLGIAAAVLLAAAGLFTAWRWILPHAPLANRPAPGVVPITSFAGSKDHPSFSPDGNQIAFAWNGGPARSRDTGRDIYVKVVGGGEPLQITSSPENDLLPAWSPDGKQIAFLRNYGNRWGVFLVPALGGAERRVADAGVGLSWSPDAKQLALADLPAPQGSGGILIHSLETGVQRPLTTPNGKADSLPAFSPDGQQVAFIRSLSTSSREVFVVDARGGDARQISFDKRPNHGLTWTADSREIVYSSNRRGDGETLWRVPASGGTPERVSVTLQCAFFPTISRRGDRLAYTESFLDINIDRYEGPGFSGGPVPGRFGEPRGLILSSREDTSPAISPGGDRIAFVSKRTGSEEVWVSNRDGGQVIQLTTMGGPPTGTPRWSPDGRWIAFDSRAAGNPDIYVVGSDGGSLRQVTRELNFAIMPAWSPDGKYLYFNSNRGGSAEIWKMPSEGGPPVQITREGAREVLPSPDGKLLYFTKNAGPGIWTIPADGGVERPVKGLEKVAKTRSWGLLRQGLYFVTQEESLRPAVRFYNFSTRAVTPLVTLPKEPFWTLPGLAISPDGRWMLTTALDHEVNDIMLIEGFQ